MSKDQRDRLINSIDWVKVGKGFYAITNPSDNTSVLYLKEGQFLALLKVVISNEREIDILANPGDTLETYSSRSNGSSTPPPSGTIRDVFYSTLRGMGFDISGGLIELSRGNSWKSSGPLEETNAYRLFTTWGTQLHMWT